MTKLIRKTQQPSDYSINQIHDAYSTSTTDTYSCNYINKQIENISYCKMRTNFEYKTIDSDSTLLTGWESVFNLVILYQSLIKIELKLLIHHV